MRSIMLVSGGINSLVAAAHSKHLTDPHLLWIDYGQRSAATQRDRVQRQASHLKLPLSELSLPHIRQVAGTALDANGNVVLAPDDLAPAHVEIDAIGVMTTLLSTAAQFARRVDAQVVEVGTSELADEIELGCAAGEGAPHRRRELYYLLNLLFEQLAPGKMVLKLGTPLIELPRGEIIKLGYEYDVPFDLAWTCTDRGPDPCGTCVDCNARTEAFLAANLADPLTAASI